MRAEDVGKKAEQAKDKVQEKAGEVANKASGKVGWNEDTECMPRTPNDSHVKLDGVPMSVISFGSGKGLENTAY